MLSFALRRCVRFKIWEGLVDSAIEGAAANMADPLVTLVRNFLLVDLREFFISQSGRLEESKGIKLSF